jgi:hypothetical protein
VSTHKGSIHVDRKIIMAEVGHEVRDAHNQIQDTRFHENSNEELELPRPAAFVLPQTLPDSPYQEA